MCTPSQGVIYCSTGQDYYHQHTTTEPLRVQKMSFFSMTTVTEKDMLQTAISDYLYHMQLLEISCITKPDASNTPCTLVGVCIN